MTRDLSDYVDVAERIRTFKAEYPEGSLQTWEGPKLWKAGDKEYVSYSAAAYRTPDDPRPGIGWAWEPVPGPTPFTRDSELMNAETSAWGRAIVALGFETKKIASANEVRNRQSSEREEGETSDRAASQTEIRTPSADSRSEGFQAPLPATERPASKGTLRALKETVESLQKGFPSPDPTHKYWDDVQIHMWAEFGKKESADLTEAEAVELVLEFEKRLVQAQKADEVPIG